MMLIFLMLIGYQYLVPEPVKPEKPKTAQTTAKPATPAPVAAPTVADTTALKAALGDFAKVGAGVAQNVVLENKDLKVTLSTQGGSIKEVLLKNYKTYSQQPLVLYDAQSGVASLEIETVKGKVDLHKLYFTSVAAPSGTVIFRASLADNQYVEQQYSLGAEGFQVAYNVKLVGMDALLSNQPARLFWQKQVRLTEKDATENRRLSTINYYQADESFDYLSEIQSGVEEKNLEQPAKWVALKQKYFLSALITKNAPLQSVRVKAVANEQDSLNLKTLEVEARLPIADLKVNKGNYEYYFGPNDFQVVSKVTEGFWQNVYLGYAFVRPINRYVFVPLFGALEQVISNYGLLIFVLVLLIKTVLLPLVYRSYVSMAKMRVLSPEINAIKEKVGDDMAKLQQEQMKLYQQVGVSPLSGCVPMLLQLPILMSVFFLFPNLIELRQQSFLWAEDLSTYDSIIRFPFSVPFLGSHLSVFTVLMTISSLAYAYYNNQITPDQPGSPVNMKMIGYITPVIFMFVLNSFPAGLSFYYFVSNLITITQQLGIRRFVDEDKIRTILEENRKKFASGTVKKSKFQEMLAKSMQAAEEAKKQQQDTSKNTPSTKKKK